VCGLGPYAGRVSRWPEVGGVVELPDGRRVRGTGVRHARGDVPAPEFAVYLLGRDPGVAEWPALWVRWPDFRLPTSTDDAVAALRDAHARAGDERVELACAGGRGRTGTALAVLAVLSGVGPDDAVAWVREHYHPKAVETRPQRRWVEQVGRSLVG
jgi:hypothetical protein